MICGYKLKFSHVSAGQKYEKYYPNGNFNGAWLGRFMMGHHKNKNLSEV